MTFTSSGAAEFVSDLWEVSVDDVKLFEKCGIMQYVDESDSFLVHSPTSTREETSCVYIPPHLCSRDGFTKEERLLAFILSIQVQF